MAKEVELDIKVLEKIKKVFKGKSVTLKVGVLGAKTSRRGGGKDATTNAEVGAVHEFGAPGRNIPQRSFLRVPLSTNLGKEIKQAGLLTDDAIKTLVKQGSLVPYMNTIGTLAVGVVLDAFETSGNGQWPPWKDPNYHNGGGMLLVDTQQLRNSIDFKVEEDA